MRFLARSAGIRYLLLAPPAVVLAALAAAPTARGDDPPGPLHIVTVAGTPNIGDGGPALQGQLVGPGGMGLAFDGEGNLYVSEVFGARVRRITPGGTITTLAGTGIQGNTGNGPGGAPATEVRLSNPHGLAVENDAQGKLRYLYLSDSLNDQIRRIDAAGTITLLATGVAGPQGLALELNPDGTFKNLYVAEFRGHRVSRVDGAGVVTTFAGTGTATSTGDGGNAVLATLNQPNGLALELGAGGSLKNLYISERAGNRVRRVNELGTISTFATGFMQPSGLVLDAEGGTLRYLYVAERNGHRVRRVGPSGTVEPVVGSGTGGLNAQGAQVALTQSNALALARHADGTMDLYINELAGQRIRRLPIAADRTFSEASLTTFAGTGIALDGIGVATSRFVRTPAALAFEPGGKLLFTEFFQHRLRSLDAAGSVATVAGTASPAPLINNVPATQGTAQTPGAIAIELAADGTIRNTYFAEREANRVRRISAAGVISILAGAIGGGAGSSGDNGPATAALLSQPSGLAVAFDAAGKANVYIAEFTSNRIRRVDGGGIITTFVGGLAGPQGLAVELNPDGTLKLLYVAETAGHRIRKIAPDGTSSPIAGTGNAGFSGDGGLATAAELSEPNGLALEKNADGTTTITFADSANHRIRQIDGAGIITTVAGGGAGFGDGGLATAVGLKTPYGVAVDSDGNVYFSEHDGHRIRRLNLAAKVHICPHETNATRVVARVELFAAGSISSVDPTTLTLRMHDPASLDPTSPASAAYPDTAVVGDDDANGILDLTAEFDLPSSNPSLFPAVFRVEGRLESGRTFSGDALIASAAIDTSPPVITVQGANPAWVACGSGPYVDLGGATISDDCDHAPDLHASDPGAINTSVRGTCTVVYTGEDATGNEAAPKTRVVRVVAGVTGWLPPLGEAIVPIEVAPPGPSVQYKKGRTVPLKLRTACGATLLGEADLAAPEIIAILHDGAPLDLTVVDIDAGGDPVDAGALFRPAGDHWQFNLSTQSLPAGKLEIVLLVDGRPYHSLIQLK